VALAAENLYLSIKWNKTLANIHADAGLLDSTNFVITRDMQNLVVEKLWWQNNATL